MELGGRWQATLADDDLRRHFPDPDLDDRDWAEIAVPHHWRSHEAFAASDGPIVYRRRFEAPGPDPLTPGRRTWLQFDGLFYQGDAWLDGAYLGDTEGYFFPHCFEVTELLAERSEHLLALELTCDRPRDKTAKRNLTGVFQDWDCFDQDWNPGGIWRPVRLFETGAVRIAGLRVLCIDAGEQRATVEIRATLEASEAGTISMTTTIGRTGGVTAAANIEAEHSLAAGRNEVRWRLPVEQPDLWWPHALGGQPLYDVTVSVGPADDASDTRTVRTGLRRFQMKNFVATVNGERLFLKGANQGPVRRELGEATPEQLEGDVLLAREAGLDLLRVHGHVTRPEFYDAADRHGVLLWQDLPLQWGYSGVRAQAVRQAAEAVGVLGHHPSLAVWCGHNEPLAITHPARRRQFLARQFLPTWNKSILDRSIHRALEKADGSRPVVAHSGVLPHPAWGTDSHLYYGWYLGEEREFPTVLARVPVLARFVSEFGAQAVPAEAAFCQPERWPDLDWPTLESKYCLQKEQFDRYVPPAAFATFTAWRDATQEYQATVIRFHIETLRRLKYRPTGGFCQFALGDGQSAVSWAVLDDQRRPKAAFAALTRACAPVIVVADRPAATYLAGETISLNVHVVSDRRVPITDARVDATLEWPGSRRTWQFVGPVAADSCALAGTITMSAPNVDGPLLLDLVLTWSGGEVRNNYVSRIALR
jgi:beta-mannosidase